MLVGNSQLIIITTVVSFAQISPLCSLLAVTVMLQKINEVLTRFHPRWAPQSNRCASLHRTTCSLCHLFISLFITRSLSIRARSSTLLVHFRQCGRRCG